MLDQLSIPIVQAPMAGGVSTPALAAAVSEAGGLGFLAAGMVPPDKLVQQLADCRALTRRPFGVNLFCPSTERAADETVEQYAELVESLAGEHGVALDEPRFDDDDFVEKLDLLVADPPAVVSFVFGCPDRADVDRLHGAGAQVWVTVTDVDEARRAVEVGSDAVVAQGAEAGGHRGAWKDDDARESPPVLDLVATLRRAFDADGTQGQAGEAGPGQEFPIIAAGGLMTGEHVAQAIGAGAAAGQLGTAFMLTPEAATSRPHRRLIASDRPTQITRAFTGRRARGIVNGWMARLDGAAPSAYPQILNLTRPMRTYGLSIGDPDLMSLWAGVHHAQARELPAAELVAELAAELSSVGGA